MQHKMLPRISLYLRFRDGPVSMTEALKWRKVMAPQAQSTKLTYEDYLLFPDDGKRHELLDGDHFVTPSPSTKHQRVSRNLLVALTALVRSHGLGEVFDAPYDVILSEENIIQPDLLFVSTARRAIVTEANIQGAPDLIVEILSDSTRKKDELTKRKLYERFGVQEYWIVDPDLESLKIFRIEQNVFVRAAELTKEANAALTSPHFPSLRLPLTEIFE